MTSAAEHHPIFSQFPAVQGSAEPGFDRSFLGVATRRSFFTPDTESPGTSALAPDLPQFNEEYFEWIDLLEAVRHAEGRFTMIELGAGWGRWLMQGAAAAITRDIPYLLVGVEAEPAHFVWMKQHFSDNRVPDTSLRLHQAAVAGTEGWVRFHVGDPTAWYGQAIDPNAPDARLRPTMRDRVRRLPLRRRGPGSGERSVERVRSLTLTSLLRELQVVDLIDLDVQGVEAEVLESAAAGLDAQVRRVHVGTHSRENESRIRDLFGRLGWENRNDYESGSEAETPWGRISFQDGVQTWINPRLTPDV